MPRADDDRMTRGVPNMTMIRKLLLPAIAVALLGGCMTGGYSYRQDRGDYYYGQPGVDYRHYGGAGGYYDGYYGYGSGYYGNSYYGRGYPYYNGGYRRGYPYGYYRPPVVVHPRPDGDNGHHQDRDDDQKAPWRDYERLKRERIERSPVVQRKPMSVPVRPATPVRSATPRPAARPAAPVRARSNDGGGSRMERVMQRARSGATRHIQTEER